MLIELGKDLKLIRKEVEDPASTSPFPDGLNRTQLQFSEELKETLELLSPELSGVSKDIQLVADIARIETAGQLLTEYSFVNTLAQSFALDLGNKRYFSFPQISFICFNTTGAPANFDFTISVTTGVGAPATPSDQKLIDTNVTSGPPLNLTIAANSNLLGVINITGTAAQATAFSSGFGATSGTFLPAWLINIPNDLFLSASLDITLTTADPGIGGTVFLNSSFQNSLNEVYR